MIESRNWKIENYHHTSIFMCLSTLTFPYHYINHELIRYDWVSLIFHGRCFNTTQIQDFYNSFETIFNVYRTALCWNRNIPCKLYQWYGYWCSGLLRRQVISSHGIDHINGRDHFVYGPTNERRRYYVTSSLTGWAHTQNYPWMGPCLPRKRISSSCATIVPRTEVIDNANIFSYFLK